GDADMVTVDDLRVALPELAFRSASVPKIIDFFTYLNIRLELQSNDKHSLSNLIGSIYNEPELEADQVNTLLRELQSRKGRRKELIDDILKGFLRVILRQACTYIDRGLDLADLFQEGCAGFIRGLDRFQFDKGATFRNYIGFWIRQGILRAIATKARTVR